MLKCARFFGWGQITHLGAKPPQASPRGLGSVSSRCQQLVVQ